MDMLETLHYTVTEADCDQQGYITVKSLVQQLVWPPPPATAWKAAASRC